ncbi:MAG: adenylate/guanylate cyclase domain-containing protein [Candidatus Marinimicrobia bacterium]|nr:adenylate/guanylate cyclase domain-containing protein [Candidatus Neomarinimicrobiota bacterium]
MTKQNKQFLKKIFTSVIVTLVSIITSVIVLLFFSDSENIFYDKLFRNFRHFSFDEDPIIIAIDQNTLNEFSHIVWPWPREIYKPVMDYLGHCGADVVAFDILFTTPGVDRINSGGAMSDSLFAASLANYGRTSLAMQFEDSSLTKTDQLLDGFLEINKNIPREIYHEYRKASLPIEIFQRNTRLLGAVNIPSTSSGIIRKLPLLFQYQGKLIPHLSLSSFMLKHQIDSLKFNIKTNSIIAGNLEIPVDKKGYFHINWYGEGGVNHSFRYYSFANILKSAIAWETGGKPIVPEEVLKGKTVFIGAIASGLLDMKSTPVSSSEPYPGVEIYTTMLKNFEQQDFLKQFPLFFWFLILIAFFAIKSAVWQSEKFLPAILLSVVLLVLPPLFSIILFRSYSILFPVVAFESGLVLDLVLSISIQYLWAGQKNRKLRKNFSRYLEPRLVKLVADSQGTFETEGNEVVATVLFTDIKGFTTISSTLNSKKVVKMLNHYFEEGEKIIFANNGMLDKYTGDGLMALFGVPVPDQQHAVSACKAIMDFNSQQEMEIDDGRFEQITTRIGVHTGPLVAGNIGSSRRVDFTAIGSTVNIAARLEQVNKAFNTTNVISADTCDLVNNKFLCRDLDYYMIRGISEPLHIYTVLCEKEKITPEIEIIMEMHDKALVAYREKAFEKAIILFQNIMEKFSNDSISEYFINKCKEKMS